MLFHLQPHAPIKASGSMTELSMHPLWPSLIFLLMQNKSLNVRFIGRHILFGAFMAKDSWHGVIWHNFLPTILNLTCQSRLVETTNLSMHFNVFVTAKKSLNVRFIGRRILFGAFMAKDMAWGDMAIFPAYQVVVMSECFTKTIPADGLELTHSTSGDRLP